MKPNQVFAYSEQFLDEAADSRLMHSTFDRFSSTDICVDGQRLTSFLNCSYLNLDMHPSVIKSAQNILQRFGVHYCCSRARTSMSELEFLEDQISVLFKGRAITFPSVTTTHSAVFPLLYGDTLIPDAKKAFIFDQFAHSSMQVHRETFAQKGPVIKVRHNDLSQLESSFKKARDEGQTPLYFADGVYSIGSLCPLREVIEISQRYGAFLYIDDAHGTLLFGDKHEGYAASSFDEIPPNLFYNFSLAKGFGCNGGGLVVPTFAFEKAIRRYSVQYNFSGPLDFAIVGAANECLELLRAGEVTKRVQKLRQNIDYFDAKMGFAGDKRLPIRMVKVGDERKCISIGKKLWNDGFLVSTAFFPVVPKAAAQLRICLNTDHTLAQIDRLTSLLKNSNCVEMNDYRPGLDAAI